MEYFRLSKVLYVFESWSLLTYISYIFSHCKCAHIFFVSLWIFLDLLFMLNVILLNRRTLTTRTWHWTLTKFASSWRITQRTLVFIQDSVAAKHKYTFPRVVERAPIQSNYLKSFFGNINSGVENIDASGSEPESWRKFSCKNRW